ncbi:uncharacterized protein SCHCODRAFT_02664994 [Schizophyllum commune H4-8]|nr:uncharacterized protein SCHCODRAFT_02664994 [Schizophyllum commune H4-8]KAI5894454.1 hypothetical protein SCHCODRAFT_02664994 [Schizophyllum commune H4-8]
MPAHRTAEAALELALACTDLLPDVDVSTAHGKSSTEIPRQSLPQRSRPDSSEPSVETNHQRILPSSQAPPPRSSRRVSDRRLVRTSIGKDFGKVVGMVEESTEPQEWSLETTAWSSDPRLRHRCIDKSVIPTLPTSTPATFFEQRSSAPLADGVSARGARVFTQDLRPFASTGEHGEVVEGWDERLARADGAGQQHARKAEEATSVDASASGDHSTGEPPRMRRLARCRVEGGPPVPSDEPLIRMNEKRGHHETKEVLDRFDPLRRASSNTLEGPGIKRRRTKLIEKVVCIHTCGPHGHCPGHKLLPSGAPVNVLLSTRGGNHYSHLKTHLRVCNDPLCPGRGKDPADKNSFRPPTDLELAGRTTSAQDLPLWKISESSVPHRLKVLFIPDPVISNAGHHLDPDQGVLHVTIVNATPEEILALERVAPGTVAQDVPSELEADVAPTPGRDTRKVAYWEWAHLPIALQELYGREVDVVGMPYDPFFEAVMYPSEHPDVYAALQNYDIIIGGALLNEDFSNPKYRIRNNDDLCRYLAGTENLQKSTVIYPPPDELLYGGDKVVLTANLDAIARDMATARPLTETRKFTENRLEVVGVYKRGYSSRCDDVVIVRSDADAVMRPENVYKTPIRLVRRTAEKEQRMTPSTGFHIIDHDWLVQAYMRSLHDHRFGELRCYVIGGRVKRIVQTSPWKDEGLVRSIPSVLLRSRKLTPICSEVFNKGDVPIAEAWTRYTCASLTHADFREGQRELVEFVEDFVYRLIRLENDKLHRSTSSMWLFCRIDVGILPGTHTMHYFVNEVERGLATCLWGWHDWADTVMDINTIAELIPSYIAYVRASQ